MNHNLHLLRNLYSTASEKYLKFRKRFDKALQSKRFHTLSKRKQASLIARLKNLYERLRSLQNQLKLAGVGLAFTLTLSSYHDAQSQSALGPFVENSGSNPFLAPIIGNRPMPAIVDIDADGDLDVFVGNYYPYPGNIFFYENVSGPNEVHQLVRNDDDNPFDGLNLGRTATPSFVDVDDDGDFDMLLGVYTYGDNFSPTHFFRNTGTATNPVFVQQTGLSNPFNGITANKYGAPHPVFVDIDDDGDPDLFVASSHVSLLGVSAIQYYENVAGIFIPTLHPLSSAANTFIDAAPAFADLDEDGDLDALIGTANGYIYCFMNEGITFTPSTGPWDPVSKTGNPMYWFPFSTRSSPEFGDFDGDSDLDILVGQDSYYYSNSNLVYFENTDGDFSFEPRNDLNVSPFGGVDVGDEASITFVDIDHDGDMDAVLGCKYFFDTYRNIFVYRNDDGVFVADLDHPLNAISDQQNWDVIYTFVDIDSDDDVDVFVGADYEIKFYRQNSSGDFIAEESPFNIGPGAGQTQGRELSIAFMDFDGDEDFDAFIGNQGVYPAEPTVMYFENQGTPEIPDFQIVTAPAPFNTLDFNDGQSNEENPNVVAVDYDNDSDIDLIVAVSAGYGDESIQTQVILFENMGDGTFTELNDDPVYTRIDELGYYNFLDLDGDGDLDSFAGTAEGRIEYLENTNPPPITNVTSSILTVMGGQPTILNSNLTINDPDNDDITYAVVSISNYISGDEELSFDEELADDVGVSGDFNNQTGELTFRGKASIANYQTLLRSVAINFTGTVPAGRRANGKTSQAADLAQDITFQVRDVDFTLTTVATVSLTIIPSAVTEINIFNAMSPNKGDDQNPFFNIQYIEFLFPENKVTIYNRWGDVVFEVKNYDNTLEGKRFNGISKDGKELTGGTYFYKIEIGKTSFTGYLSLKR